MIQDYGPQVKAVGILFLSLAWISVIMRFFVRIFMTHYFDLSDWLAVVTLLVFTVFCSFVIVGAEYGTGRHNAVLTTDDIVTSMRLWYGGQMTYVLTTWLLKIYIGIFLKQISILRSQILVIWTVIITFSIVSTYYLFLMAFQCHPVSFFWERYGVGASGTCISPTIIVASSYVHSVFTAISDWTLGTLPIFLVWNLQLSTRTKFSVAVLLSMGAIGSLATVIRIQYIHELDQTQEFLYYNALVSIWSTVEPGMGITASSLACTKPLFRNFFSHSQHPTSNATNSTWPKPPGRRTGHHNNSGSEELHLHDNVSKSIRVETVINIQPAQDDSDAEAGHGSRSEGNEINIYNGI